MIPTTVTFYGDVGFDRSYAHVIDFSNETERESYFSTRVLKTVTDCAYNKPMDALKLVCDYDTALTFTYCKFKMGSKEGHQKTVYAWVDDVSIVTDQPSGEPTPVYNSILSIKISIDPWQTFLFNFTVGESFVAREHVDRFVTHADSTRGWTLSNTTDKSHIGLEKRKGLLSSLKTSHTFYRFKNDLTTATTVDCKLGFICIQYVDRIDTGTLKKNIAMHIAFAPVAKTNLSLCLNGTFDKNKWGRCLSYNEVFNDTFLGLLDIDPQKVASICYIPYDIYSYIGNGSSEGTNFTYIDLQFSGFDVIRSNPYPFPGYDVGGLYVYYDRTYKVDEIQDMPITFGKTVTLSATGLTVPTQYVSASNPTPYSKDYEPQLFKQPYRYVSIIDECGVERGILPDIMANVATQTYSVKLNLVMDAVEVRLRIVPVLPNGMEIDNTYWIEYSLTGCDVLSDNWLSYLTQQRDTDRQMIQSQINQQAIASAVGGVSSGVGMGGSQAMSIGRGTAAGSTSAAGLSELGGFAAGGLVGLGVGAVNTVGGYLASSYFCFEQQDIREEAIRRKANNVIVSGTFRGAFADCIKFVLMECDETTINNKAREFHKYGYNTFFYETPNTKSRKYFNYIATSLVKIEGALNNEIKMALAQIFNNGVTIWHGDYISELTGIGDYSKENIERSLIT